MDAALDADDELHGVPVRVCGNRSLVTVLEQFTPILRRVERLRFASIDGRDSVGRHDELIRLCAAGDSDGRRSRGVRDLPRDCPSEDGT